jgi:hypothetical protein
MIQYNIAMLPDQLPQIEILPRDAPQAYPGSVIIREVALPKYFIEDTQVIIEPQLDSHLLVIHTEGDAKGVEMVVPSYNFYSTSGQKVEVTSGNGEIRVAFVS